jgi:hypothetical protein
MLDKILAGMSWMDEVPNGSRHCPRLQHLRRHAVLVAQRVGGCFSPVGLRRGATQRPAGVGNCLGRD